MSNASTKTFDAVQAVRVIRDAISAKIATMTVDQQNRWLQSTAFSDSRLQRLMDLSARQSVAADRNARGTATKG